MSKHKKHRRHEYEYNSSPNVDNNLSELLNNVDVNQLAAALNYITNNQQRTPGGPEQPPPNPMMGAMGMMGMGGGRELLLLNAIKPFLSPQRAEMLDKFLQAFNQGETWNQQPGNNNTNT